MGWRRMRYQRRFVHSSPYGLGTQPPANPQRITDSNEILITIANDIACKIFAGFQSVSALLFLSYLFYPTKLSMTVRRFLLLFSFTERRLSHDHGLLFVLCLYADIFLSDMEGPFQAEVCTKVTRFTQLTYYFIPFYQPNQISNLDYLRFSFSSSVYYA